MTQDTDTVTVRYMVNDVQAAIGLLHYAPRVRAADKSFPYFRRRQARRGVLSGEKKLGWTTHARRSKPGPWGGTVFICSLTISARRSTASHPRPSEAFPRRQERPYPVPFLCRVQA